MNKPAKVTSVQDALDELDDARSGLARLREPFPAHQISKLPKETKAQTEARKNNREGINCTICGGWHHPRAVHLDYVGHAALTDRLLDVDPEWSWEPMGTTPEGLPAINGGLWIKLTVCGVSRYGFGAADGKIGGDAIKEMIGDALRNAAMRFGAALDLWHKGDLHADDEPEARSTITQTQFEELEELRLRAGVSEDRFNKRFQVDALALLPADKFEEAKAALAERIKSSPLRQQLEQSVEMAK